MLWWAGDVLGILVFTPLLLAFWNKENIKSVQEGREEAFIISLSVILLGLTLFGPFSNILHIHYATATIVFPFIVWAALRFHVRGAACACTFLSIVAVIGTSTGHGPFIISPGGDPFILLQLFMGAVAITALVTGGYASEKERVGEALRISEARFKRLYDCNMIGVIFATLKGEILDANDAFLSMVNYTREDLVSGKIRWDAMTPPAFRELDESKVEELVSTGVATPWEKEYIRKDGSAVPVVVGGATLADNTNETICFVLDMSERELFDMKLRQAYDHVKTLNERLQLGISETHHRVKNSLQVISSLLSIELRKHGSITAENLRKIISHVQSFATLHDILTVQVREEGLVSSVCAKSIIEHLIGTMSRSLGERKISFSLDPCPITPRQGSSLAVVANELLSNAFKYGDGNIEVRLKVCDSEALFEVVNNGSQFPTDFDVQKRGSTGLKLVCNLCKSDLGGEPLFDSPTPEKARVSVRFACLKKEAKVGAEMQDIAEAI